MHAQRGITHPSGHTQVYLPALNLFNSRVQREEDRFPLALVAPQPHIAHPQRALRGSVYRLSEPYMINLHI